MVPATPAAAASAGRALGATLLAAVLLALLPAAASAASDDGLIVERFDARLLVDPGGTVEVTEEIVVDFGEEEFHGIVRVIPVSYPLADGDTQVSIPAGREPADYRRVIAIEAVEVTSTAPDDLEISREAGLLSVRIGDPDRTVTGVHSYELRYLVRGALNAFDDRAELTWDVTGHAWEDPILAATATVTGAEILAGACARGPEGDATACEQSDVAATEATFATGRLDPGEGLTVSVGFPPGAVEVPAPMIEERWRLASALAGDGSVWPLTAVTALLGLVAVALTARYRRQRVRAVTPAGQAAAGVMLRGDPPDGLRPAQVRMLTAERVDDVSLGATLLDLAARGHIDIEPLDEGGDEGDATRYRFRRTDRPPDDLLAYERSLLDGMFAAGDTVTSAAFAEDHTEDQARFDEQVAADALDRGWFPERPVSVRVRRGLLGAGLVAAALVVLGVALALTRVALAAVPLVLAAAVVAVLVYLLPTRTEEGRRLLVEARGFREYMTSTGSGPPLEGRAPAEVFGHSLPYAMALGVAPRWVERFEATGVPAQEWMPVYYLPIFAAAGRDPGGFASSVASFGAHVSPAPSASTSSGGVTSGGGVGGGGGGGW